MPIPWKALAPFAIVAFILGLLVGQSLVRERPSIPQAAPTAVVIVPTVPPVPLTPTVPAPQPAPTPTDVIIICVPLPQGGADCTGQKP